MNVNKRMTTVPIEEVNMQKLQADKEWIETLGELRLSVWRETGSLQHQIETHKEEITELEGEIKSKEKWLDILDKLIFYLRDELRKEKGLQQKNGNSSEGK